MTREHIESGESEFKNPEKIVETAHYRFTVAAESEGRVPSHNSDASMFIENRERDLIHAGVFDGLGKSGMPAATFVASSLAERLAAMTASTGIGEIITPSGYLSLHSRAIQTINEQVRAEHPGSETTLTVVSLAGLPRDSRAQVAITNVGDSRVYLFDPQEGLHKLTKGDKGGWIDQEIRVAVWQQSGFQQFDQEIERTISLQATRIQDFLDTVETDDDFLKLPPEDRTWARIAFDHRNVLDQSIGQKDVPKLYQQIYSVPLGSALLLTSDGIHDNLSQRQLQHLCEERWQRSGDLAREVIRAARAASHEHTNIRRKPDDMTALAIHVESRVTTHGTC